MNINVFTIDVSAYPTEQGFAEFENELNMADIAYNCDGLLYIFYSFNEYTVAKAIAMGLYEDVNESEMDSIDEAGEEYDQWITTRNPKLQDMMENDPRFKQQIILLGQNIWLLRQTIYSSQEPTDAVMLASFDLIQNLLDEHETEDLGDLYGSNEALWCLFGMFYGIYTAFHDPETTEAVIQSYGYNIPMTCQYITEMAKGHHKN